jgi:hypothetical protein
MDEDANTRLELFKKMDPKKLEERIIRVEKEIENLTENIRKRRVQDSMVTARVREELDFNANIKKEDRIIMTGLTCKTPMPHNADEKRIWLRQIVGKVLNQIDQNAGDHVVFATLGRKISQDITLAEVKLDSRELTLKIRKLFAAKKGWR